ncbi:hypothetical protein [Salinibaculum salinum]|uniref:hypothetical protein n=1 Tax=Salinibaculum salinum TaxID=3131996 RepID=UPI0030ED007E
MSRARGTPGTKEANVLIRNNSDLLNHLPNPPETFVAMDLPEQYHGVVRSLCRVGVIEKVGFVEYEHLDSTNNDRREYRIRDWVPPLVEESIESRDAICPCGHSGFSNCGDHFECQFDLCEQEFDRDELEVDA